MTGRMNAAERGIFMEMHIAEIAERIRGLREMLDISTQEMAQVTGVTPEEYKACESGDADFSFTFLLKCAERFGVDLVELLTGTDPKLSFYMVTRRGHGLPIERRKGFEYSHLAYLFKGKMAETFLVTAPFSTEDTAKNIPYSTHDGQEFDFILKGSLKVDFDGHEEILNEGDAVYYDSGHRHGMVAYGGQDCEFLAVVIKKQ